MAFSMVYEGARGQTAEEIQQVFHFPKDDNIRRPNFASIYNDINREDRKSTINIANALWAQKDYPFLKEYFTTIEKYYGGKVTNLDFIKAPEKSRLTINNWVEKQTQNRIKDLIPPGGINPLTRLIITNAIYFKGEWAWKFDKNLTKEMDFKVSNTKTVKAEMMHMPNKNFRYVETANIQILEMCYMDNDLSMLILLPKDNNLQEIESLITLENLNGWKKGMLPKTINIVIIPKFKFKSHYYLNEHLSEIGMPTAFSSNADFSGMNGKTDLFISQVIHQASVEVNEEGTVASAVIRNELTIGMGGGGESIKFIADHPFIFLIQNRYTGNILFIGRVIDPTL